MRARKPLSSSAWRRLAQVAIASIGVISILGSGGGLAPSLDCLDWCPDYSHPPPHVSVAPPRMTVQIGATATFTADVMSFAAPQSVSLRWCRLPRGAAVCSTIAGASARTLTVPGANLDDDGAQFQITVTDANGTAQASGALTVSSAPGVVFEDADFVDSDWSVKAVVEPATSGTAHSESRAASGGNPGAFRSVTYLMPQAPFSVRLLHTSISGAYDPAAQGAIHVIDFTLDCQRLSFDGAHQVPTVIPMIEQAGRRFTPALDNYGAEWFCPVAQWGTLPPTSSVSVNEFALIDGPVCGPAETCPDFSAQAAPIHFGFVTSAQVSAGASPGSIVQGIDNWRVTVWRR